MARRHTSIERKYSYALLVKHKNPVFIYFFFSKTPSRIILFLLLFEAYFYMYMCTYMYTYIYIYIYKRKYSILCVFVDLAWFSVPVVCLAHIT